MDRTARQGQARVLAVLAVLLGMLAMHGLSSTHHAAASVTTATVPAGTQDTGAHDTARHDPAAVQATVALRSDGPGCGVACSELSVLCVAVLAGVALALLLARRRPTPLPHAPARAMASTRAPPARPTTAPDPVRELCVSRT